MKRLNNKGIKHKDLKPQNILVQLKDGKPLIKIVDFDVSTVYKKEMENSFTHETNTSGTNKYAAPELRDLMESGKKGKQLFNSNKADVYSLGITLFEVAVIPQSSDKIELINDPNLENLQLKVNELIETKVANEELKKLLGLLLVVDPRKRMTFRNIKLDNAVLNEESDKLEFDNNELEELYFS